MYTVVVEIRNAERAGLVGPGIDKKKLGLVLPLSQLKRPVTPTEILCIFWKYFSYIPSTVEDSCRLHRAVRL